jgi:hypothetical protein
LLFPHFIECLNKLVVNHERNGYVQADSTQTWNCSFVESKPVKIMIKYWFYQVESSLSFLRFWSFVFHDLNGTVERVLVTARLETLHARLDHIDGRVAVDAGCASDQTKKTGPQNGHRCVQIEAFVDPILTLERFHDKEANGLIRTLFDDGRRDALVHAANAVFSHDLANAVREALVLRISRVLVMNKLDFHGLHGSHGENRF